MNSTEYSLLLQSHDEEKAKQLLAERYSLQGSQKPFLVLHDGVNDTTATTLNRRRRNRSPKLPSQRQQRKSAVCAQLQKFRASGKRDLENYLPLNELWNEYITSMLGKASGVPAAQLILSADWNGAQAKIVACRNPSYRALSGILVYESKSQWCIATKNGPKMVAKSGTVIELAHPQQSFQVVGDRVGYRPSERSTRKFKPHHVSDLTGLINLDA